MANKLDVMEIGANGFYRVPMHRECPQCGRKQTITDVKPGEKFGWDCAKCGVVWVVEVSVSLMDHKRLKLEWKRSIVNAERP